MEYFLKEIIQPLMKQRDKLVSELSELNENLPNYSIKIMELNTQITNIDTNVRDYVYAFKDFELVKEQNELTIKTQTNN